MNVALHGMEQAAGARYYRNGNVVPGCPILVRYADDVIALCHSRQQAEQVQARLAGWLEPRGLAFNQDKTKITHLDQGVNFLGFEIRRFGGKLLTKPSRDAMRQIRNRLSAKAVALRGANADAVIARLNPVITGWAAYYRIGVSSRAYGKLDAHMWHLAWKWARHAHPNKSRHWVTARYFGMFNPSRNDKWLFGSREPAATSAGSPGRKSSGTSWSPGGHPPMTLNWPNTGPSAASASGPRSAPRPGTCCAASAAGALSAGDCCSTPATNRTTSASGSSGTPPSGKQSARKRSPP